MIVEPHSPTADLFSENTILFREVVNHKLLMLVHPSTMEYDEKRKWI
jgi:hypothetical protein